MGKYQIGAGTRASISRYDEGFCFVILLFVVLYLLDLFLFCTSLFSFRLFILFSFSYSSFIVLLLCSHSPLPPCSLLSPTSNNSQSPLPSCSRSPPFALHSVFVLFLLFAILQLSILNYMVRDQSCHGYKSYEAVAGNSAGCFQNVEILSMTFLPFSVTCVYLGDVLIGCQDSCCTGEVTYFILLRYEFLLVKF